jgi:hypothetical protein
MIELLGLPSFHMQHCTGGSGIFFLVPGRLEEPLYVACYLVSIPHRVTKMDEADSGVGLNQCQFLLNPLTKNPTL